ncbi:MAG TPA: trypsin-like serine protease [Vicinamibacterales bacterium]|nr:trypsin-like serine protease [Vicinamibacterales bacterium]
MNMKQVRTFALLAALLMTAVPAVALIWSQPDGNGHPYVGLVVFDVDGTPSHRCSGSLISPTVFLTAGHCTDGTDAARVWFETRIQDPSYPFGGGTSISGTPHTHPAFGTSFPNSSDVGVVVLDVPVVLNQYAQLAPSGVIDGLARQRGLQSQLFTLVGYGDQAIVPFPISRLIRYRATPQLVELSSANTGGWNIHLSSNPGKPHPGGACFGDSGGPALIGNTNLVAGVGSFVLNYNCTGAGFYYRVDTAYARQFINPFLN